MAQAASSKILRVGVIQGGKIIEERHIKKRESVTVGSDAKNTIVIPASTLPGTFPVFEYKGNQYSLVFTEDMDGRLRIGNSDVDFAALKSQGTAKQRGNVYVMALNDSAKGKVSIGEVTLLFQFVTPPPEPAKTELPPNIKGSVWQSMDRLFFGILATSLLIHFSGATVLILAPMPAEREISLEDLSQGRFAKILTPVKLPEPEKTQDTGADDKADDADKSKKDKKDDNAGKKVAKPSGGDAAKTRQMVQSRGLLKILGSAGGSGGGALADVLGEGTGAGDIGAALAGAGGVGVATADAIGSGGPKGGGAGNVAGIGELGTSGGGNVNLGAKGDVAVRGNVKDSAPQVDASSVNREDLARYVRGRLKAIQNCYEKELKRNPSLKGRVEVRFVISRSGRATEIEIEQNTLGNDAVGSCIRAVIRGWMFPFKPDEDVAVTYPFVFSPAS